MAWPKPKGLLACRQACSVSKAIAEEKPAAQRRVVCQQLEITVQSGLGALLCFDVPRPAASVISVKA